MRILCRSGHFSFYPRNESEIGRFSYTFGQMLVRDGDFYTFEALKGLPKYSIKGKAYGGLTATKTYAGEIWEVLNANGFVYNVKDKKLVVIDSISIFVNPPEAGYFWLSDATLIQPGSRNSSGQRVTGYDAGYAGNTQSLFVFGVDYD